MVIYRDNVPGDYQVLRRVAPCLYRRRSFLFFMSNLPDLRWAWSNSPLKRAFAPKTGQNFFR